MTTFLLLHGAGDRGSSFDLLAAELRAHGHEVVAPDLPSDDDGARWADYADAAVAAVGDRDELVVVAHSLSGYVAPLVCERARVELLVLLAAMVPAHGERAADYWTATGLPEAAREAGFAGLDDRELFVHDLPDDLATWALGNGRDQSGTPMDEPWPLAAWPDVPTRFVLFRDDRVFPAAYVRRVARERLGLEPDEVDGGHCAYLSRPAEVAAVLDGLAARASRWS